MKLMTSYRPPQHYRASYEEKFRDFPSSTRALLTTLLDLDSGCRGDAASALESEVSYALVANDASCSFYGQL